MNIIKLCLASGIAISALAYCLPISAQEKPMAAKAQTKGTPLYKNAAAPVSQRVEDLLARMTLEEKIEQLRAIWEEKTKVLDAKGKFDPAKMTQLFPNGIGGVTRPSDRYGPGSPREKAGLNVRETVELVNAMQLHALTKTRLGIPILFHEEGLHGNQALGATSFPIPIGLASSWDRELIKRVNSVIGREIRARGATLALTPVVDIARDPRWGRIEETFGEDPYLVSEMGVASIQGLQGTSVSEYIGPDKVLATLKHMSGHGEPQGGQNTAPAQVSERELRENFFPPFEEAVRRTNIRAVMPSYNEVDGVPSHVNKWMLNSVLRKEWGFKGALVSDYYAIKELENKHHIAENVSLAAKEALETGVDIDLPDGVAYAELLALVKAGKIKESTIDNSVRRVLELKFISGLFENPYSNAAAAEKLINNAEARALARESAVRSVVLLKNDGTLPLTAKGKIAVIGPNAATPHLGGYPGIPPVQVALLEGIRTKVGKKAEILYSEGVKITESDDWWQDAVKQADPEQNRKRIAEAVEVARGSDQIILAIGGNEQTSREGWAANHLGDSASVELVGEQQELFDALKKLGKPITVVLINGKPTAVTKVAAEANALLETWYTGEQGGNAVADILFGDANPGGKLPVSIPRSTGQLPIYYNYKPSAKRGYLFDSNEALFPFGFGLSYSTFTLGAPVLSQSKIGAGQSAQVTVQVTNTSARTGDETVQLYIRDKVSSVTQPVKELKGFERITLKPGETRNVTFTITPHALSMWNKDMKRVVEPGEFDIMTGSNSADVKTVTLTVIE
jgi:beta-glucosidase